MYIKAAESLSLMIKNCITISRLQNSVKRLDRVGSGQSLCGSGRTGSRKRDPRRTLSSCDSAAQCIQYYRN